jgi:hypothetical protein
LREATIYVQWTAFAPRGLLINQAHLRAAETKTADQSSLM